MIDLKLLTHHFEEAMEKLSKRNIDAVFLNTLRESSLNYKQKKSALEELQATQNAKTKQFAKIKQEGGNIDALKSECDLLKAQIALYAQEVELWENKLQELSHNIPNIPILKRLLVKVKAKI